MARGRFQKKRSPLGPILIILVLAAIAAAVLYFTGVLGHRHHCSAPADCTVARYCDECGKLMEAAHQDHTAGRDLVGQAAVQIDALTQALCHYAAAFRIHQLIFQGRGTGVDYEDVHGYLSTPILC